jgi:LPXTG-motif cell wall-anchored protein
MKYLVSINVILLTFSPAFGQSEADIARQKEALAEWKNDIHQSSTLSSKERIKLLGECVVKMTKRPIFQIDERWEIHREAQALMLSIPGHAEYYADRINTLRRQIDEPSDGTETDRLKKNSLKHTLLREQQRSFETLQQLPSPQTIRVLGEFLTDERGRTIVNPSADILGQIKNSFQRPNSVYAANALATLPLKNKPHAPKAGFHDNQPPREWINWYTQIKEGRRTFSFEGDPNEYDLNGPVRGAKNPDLPRTARRPDQKDEASSPSSTPKSTSSALPWLTAIAAVLLALGGWLFFRKKQTSA